MKSRRKAYPQMTRAAWRKLWSVTRNAAHQAEATGRFDLLTPLQAWLWQRCQPHNETHQTPAQKLAIPF